MTGKMWVRDPASGGCSIPEAVRRETDVRLRQHAEQHFKGRHVRLEIRFRGKFCYVDAYTEPVVPGQLPSDSPETRDEYLDRIQNTPIHLCRLRYFSEDRWSFAMFTYSHEKYEEACFPSGDFWGRPEEAFDVAARLYIS